MSLLPFIALVHVVFMASPLIVGADATTLKILVPLKMGFEEFVSWAPSERPVTSDSTVNFTGFAIEVFRECIRKLDYTVNYTLVGYGDGINDPDYNQLVQKLVSKVLFSTSYGLYHLCGPRLRVKSMTLLLVYSTYVIKEDG
mgnify:FL=1